MREFRPVPAPSGDLQPPGRLPPTAVGAATPPEPSREPRPTHVRAARRRRPSPLHVALQLAAFVPLVGLKLGVRALRKLAHR